MNPYIIVGGYEEGDFHKKELEMRGKSLICPPKVLASMDKLELVGIWDRESRVKQVQLPKCVKGGVERKLFLCHCQLWGSRTKHSR